MFVFVFHGFLTRHVQIAVPISMKFNIEVAETFDYDLFYFYPTALTEGNDLAAIADVQVGKAVSNR